MAISFRDLGQLDRADECERRAIEFARQGGSAPLVLLARLGRAEVCLRAGDATLAEVRAREARRGFAALGDAINQADALRTIGASLTAQGRFEAASEALDTALALARTHHSVLHEAETLRARAELRARSGDEGLAETDARAALAIFERLGAVHEVDALRRWLDELFTGPSED
jgi:tetratricopeptide (TPR) repeat protein